MKTRCVNRYFLYVIAFASISAGDEDEARRQESLRKLIDESVHWYELRQNAENADALKPVVLMRWPNVVRGSIDGATAVWISNGRPEAIASIYPWQGKFVHDFDSLSRGRIVAHRDGEVVWSPTAAGVNFAVVPDAPKPAQSPAKRLRQMKALAGKFTSTLLGWNEDGSEREQLRLMPRPLYRYGIKEKAEVLDGALFAFVTGTDPETLLLIEAVRSENDWRWEYAFVRQSSAGLVGRFGDRIVWTAKKYPESNNPRSTHIQFLRPLNEVLPPDN